MPAENWQQLLRGPSCLVLLNQPERTKNTNAINYSLLISKIYKEREKKDHIRSLHSDNAMSSTVSQI